MSSAKDLFLDALDLTRAERADFLEQRCSGDPELRAEVERLLSAHGASGRLFGNANAGAVLIAGAEIGSYVLREEVGRGGFATVWRAHQAEPVRRTVALKLLHAGLDTDTIVARFQVEHQALALMDHPGIAKVFDGGATKDGRPWFAMEFVDGVPITDYCETHRLNRRQRLDLFIDVCRAVQHAHQKGVIHRDIKPSNILVATIDGAPAPKVIDFGIAKAVEADLGAEVSLTDAGQLIGTPAYMSPEQVDPRVDLDTRCDVYALGALLYELLCGCRLFDDETLRSAGLQEILRLIREVDPPRPSLRPGRTTTIIARELRGDLDWIVMRCLEKDRDRRYDSVGLVADEISRHLKGDPVLAGPPDVLYRARKFVARHRGWLGAAAVAVLLLVAGITVSSIQMVRAQTAEAETAVELAKFEELSAFYESILRGVDPAVALGKDTELMREVLDAAAGRVEQELGDVREVEATVRRAIGNAYLSIAAMEPAERELRRVVELWDALGRERRSAKAAHELGALYLHQRQHEVAGPWIERAVAYFEDRWDPTDGELMSMWSNLATLRRFQGRLEESTELHERVLQARLELDGEEHEGTIRSINNLAGVYADRGLHQEASERYRRALELQRRIHKPEHPEVLKALNNLAGSLRDLGQTEECLELLVEAHLLKQDVFEEGHPSLLVSFSNLALTLQALGRPQDALDTFADALDMIERSGVEATANAVQLRFNYAGALWKLNQRQQAMENYQISLDAAVEHLTEQHPITLRVRSDMGWSWFEMGRHQEALDQLQTALSNWLELKREADTFGGVLRVRLGLVRHRLGDEDQARELLQQGLQTLNAHPQPFHTQWVQRAQFALDQLGG